MSLILQAVVFGARKPILKKLTGLAMSFPALWAARKENPSYEDVAYGRTRHREVVKVPYDDTQSQLSSSLLSAFWRMHDPTDATGSFVDRGRHYGSAVYTLNARSNAALPIGGH